MLTSKQLKMMEKLAGQQRQVISDLNTLVTDIERCERTIVALKDELESVNLKHKERASTREDIHYLEDLLACAKKKLTWERHMASLQKRTPALLQRMSAAVNDPLAPPAEETREQIVQALNAIQNAMQRLEKVKTQ